MKYDEDMLVRHSSLFWSVHNYPPLWDSGAPL